MIRVIKNSEEFNEVINKPAVALYFHSQDCGLCNVLLPKLDEMLSTEYPKIPLYVINANELLELCGLLTVFTFPTVLIYFEGKESLRIPRNINLGSLKKSLERPNDILFS